MTQRTYLSILCSLFLSVCIPSFALAQASDDPCLHLVENATWQTGIQKLQELTEKGDYDAAIQEAGPLFGICGRTPELNYYTGVSLQKKGDTARALRYLQEAAKATSEFDADTVMMRKIWYTLYEAENPDRTPEAVAALTDEKIQLQAQIEDRQNRINELEKSVIISGNEASNLVSERMNKARDDYYAMTWAGAGLGIAGLLITSGGIAMVAVVKNHKEDGADYKINPPYYVGWTLLGVGAGLTITGAIVAGIAGYQYTHFDVPNTDMTVSLGLTPSSASIGLTF